MNLRKTRAQDLDLYALLEGIDQGQVVLPNFQRDFDWTDSDVRSLLGTVLSGWPIGSLLLVDGTHDFYDPRPVEKAPPVSDDIIHVILDGQQRLTALYQALYGRGDLVYALQVPEERRYDDIDTLDDSIQSFKSDAWKKFYPSPAAQWEAELLPISALRTAADFYEWRDAAVDQNDRSGKDRLTDTYRGFLAGLHNYKVPCVIIDRSIEPAAVARIFERVNRTGTPLGTFDLVVARSFTPSFNLRVLWEESLNERPLLARFLGDDGLPVLTVMALRQQSDVRQSAVLRLSGPAIRDGWDLAVDNFEAALRFAVRHLGFLDPDWIPYRPIITMLAAVNYDRPLESIEDEVVRWYWSTVIGQRYDVASNTRAVSDFKALISGHDPIGRPPVMIEEVFLEATRGQQGALHRGFLTAMGYEVVRKRGWDAGYETSREFDFRPVSLYPRGHASRLDPPAHLRTLSFALLSRAREEPDDGWEAPFLESFDPDLPPEDMLRTRLAQLHDFVRDRTGLPLRLISEAQWEREQFESD